MNLCWIVVIQFVIESEARYALKQAAGDQLLLYVF